MIWKCDCCGNEIDEEDLDDDNPAETLTGTSCSKCWTGRYWPDE